MSTKGKHIKLTSEEHRAIKGIAKALGVTHSRAVGFAVSTLGKSIDNSKKRSEILNKK